MTVEELADNLEKMIAQGFADLPVVHESNCNGSAQVREITSLHEDLNTGPGSRKDYMVLEDSSRQDSAQPLRREYKVISWEQENSGKESHHTLRTGLTPREAMSMAHRMAGNFPGPVFYVCRGSWVIIGFSNETGKVTTWIKDIDVFLSIFD